MPSFQSLRGGGRPGRKASARSVRGGIFLMIAPVMALYLLIVYRFASQHRRQAHNGGNLMPTTPRNNNEYIMWRQEEAYMKTCELHYKYNDTWGKMHAPLVDKIEAKNIVARMNAPGLKVIPTLAVLDRKNITNWYSLQFMKQLKQPYIIKSTHLSGGVARVYDNRYHCFKYCDNETAMPLDEEALRISKGQLLADLDLDYSNNGGELQYKYITPRVIFEEDVISGGKTNTDVTFWWLSNGVPVFVSQQCSGDARKGFQLGRVFVGTDYRRLPIMFNRGTCKHLPPKPKSWDTQLEVMRELGKGFPNEVVRIDVYAGGDEVWFSEFTYTSAGCWRRFTPALADGLLYGLMTGSIAKDVITPSYVERMLTDDSWASVFLDDMGASRAYPSPVDLCLRFEEFGGKRMEKKSLFDRCIRYLRRVRQYPIRCLVSMNNGTMIHSFGLEAPIIGGKSNVASCALKCMRSKESCLSNRMDVVNRLA